MIFNVGGSMKNTFVNHSLNYLIKNNACSDKQINIFRYTLESLYSLITKTVVVLLLSIILKTFSITLITLLLYSILRGFAFGIHASKNIYCWMITLTVYIVGPLLIKYFTLPTNYVYLCLGIGVLSMLFWAPADTPSRPLLNKKKRVINKTITISLSIFYIISSFYFNDSNFYEIISFIFLLETICICPLTYKVFKVPYRNYRTYKN